MLNYKELANVRETLDRFIELENRAIDMGREKIEAMGEGWGDYTTWISTYVESLSKIKLKYSPSYDTNECFNVEITSEELALDTDDWKEHLQSIKNAVAKKKEEEIKAKEERKALYYELKKEFGEEDRQYD